VVEKSTVQFPQLESPLPAASIEAAMPPIPYLVAQG